MNEQIIATGIAALADVDNDIAQAVDQLGIPSPRIRPAGFEAFLSAIISQQISTTAARAIMGRVITLMPVISAQALLSQNDLALRTAGLSFRKIEYAKGLADAVITGRFDIDSLGAMSDTEAIKAITSLRGFGRWSADIYLLLSLKRQDIFPADDLALLEALKRLKRLPTRPTPKQARELISHWAPWRSVGSLLLWDYYRKATT
ncbi:MAG: DNA-3-methyladenine glycosylase 2 family protein [Motiliproteus sp.]